MSKLSDGPYAELRKASLVRISEHHPTEVAVGFIYNDLKKHFKDGTWIRTSAIMSKEGNFIRTLNTTYKLV